MTIVLLHPVGLDHASWGGVPIDDALALDLPGHGGTPAIEAASLGDVADWVVGAVDETDASHERFDLVGVSLGGMVALHAALRHPARIRSLVVACAPAATPAEVMLERAAETERLGMRGVTDVTLTRWFSPGVLAGDAEVVAATRSRLEADDPMVVAAYWRLIAAHDVAERLGELALPVTVVAGRSDVSVPPAAARALASGIPGARYVELDGAHMLHLEAPKAFADVVREHVTTAAESQNTRGARSY